MALVGAILNPVQWRRAKAILQKAPEFMAEVDRAIQREAVRMEGVIKRGIRDQAPGGRPFRPLHPVTVAAKRSSKALIDTGTLIGGIKASRLGTAAWFVGVHRTARGRRGEKLFDLAVIHEFGAKPRVTERMRRFLARKPRKGERKPVIFLKRTTRRIKIPARPFIRPSFRAERKRIAATIALAVTRAVARA